MPTQAERRAATRTKILDSATRLFVGNGYEATTIADILRDAGISRGALYHHFDSKDAVLEAIFDTTAKQAIAAGSRQAPQDASATETLIAGCLGWLDEVRAPATAAILFDLGPSALGWARCREIEEAYSMRVLRLSLGRAVDAGELCPASPELAARAINAVLAELALVALAPDAPPPSSADIEATVRSTVMGFAC